MKKLKSALIGCGGIGSIVYLEGLLKNKRVDLVAVCDFSIERAKAAAKNNNIKSYYSDYKEMISKEDIDAVFVATPNFLHSEISVYAMQNGLHVFCEKPDAISVDQVLEMKETSEKTNKLLMVMRNNRFRNDTMYLKKLIEDGELGEIYAAKCGWVRRRGIPKWGGWFTDKKMSGGGPLIDLGVHMIDLTLWLMGNPKPYSVSGSTFSKFTDDLKTETNIVDIEDLAMGYIRLENNACINFEFSWATNLEKEKNYFDLYGTKAGVRCHMEEGLIIFGESYGNLTDTKPLFEPEHLHAHLRNIDHFVSCLLDGDKPLFTPQQGVDMIKLLCGIYESSDKMCEIKL